MGLEETLQELETKLADNKKLEREAIEAIRREFAQKRTHLIKEKRQTKRKLGHHKTASKGAKNTRALRQACEALCVLQLLDNWEKLDTAVLDDTTILLGPEVKNNQGCWLELPNVGKVASANAAIEMDSEGNVSLEISYTKKYLPEDEAFDEEEGDLPDHPGGSYGLDSSLAEDAKSLKKLRQEWEEKYTEIANQEYDNNRF